MDVLSSFLKGMGYSLLPMVLSLVGICGVRLFWIYAIFPMPEFSTYQGLMISYPASWVFSLVAFTIASLIALIKLRNPIDKDDAKPEENQVDSQIDQEVPV